MLARDADGLRGQEQDRQVLGETFGGAPDAAVVEDRIDAKRQMRPVLLDRGHRQHGYDLAHVGPLEVRPGHLRPEPRRRHGLTPRLTAVQTRQASAELTRAGGRRTDVWGSMPSVARVFNSL